MHSHINGFSNFRHRQKKISGTLSGPLPLNGQSNTNCEERYLLTVPKIVPTLRHLSGSKNKKTCEKNFLTFDLKQELASCNAIRTCIFLSVAENV